MSTIQPTKRPFAARRKAVTVSQEDLVHSDLLDADNLLPLVVEPKMDSLELIAWVKFNRAWIQSRLTTHGGILFRGWSVKSIDEFEQFTKTFVEADLLDYSYRSTPRSEVSGRIYSSTDYPADQSIPFHNEMAYTSCWPLVLSFHCVQNAEQGGETPIVDSRKIYDSIPAEIREEFTRRRVTYVRNYGGGLDLPWQNVFQTSEKEEVERFCDHSGIEYEWRSNDRLRTRQTCQAVATHPSTKEPVWFNQAHLFHVSSLDAATRERFLKEFPEEDLPRNAYFGDGSAIDSEHLEVIRAAYQSHAVVYPWQEGDVLLLDNMLVAHARTPFVGKRRVVVGMAQPYSVTPE